MSLSMNYDDVEMEILHESCFLQFNGQIGSCRDGWVAKDY